VPMVLLVVLVYGGHQERSVTNDDVNVDPFLSSYRFSAVRTNSPTARSRGVAFHPALRDGTWARFSPRSTISLFPCSLRVATLAPQSTTIPTCSTLESTAPDLGIRDCTRSSEATPTLALILSCRHLPATRHPRIIPRIRVPDPHPTLIFIRSFIDPVSHSPNSPIACEAEINSFAGQARIRQQIKPRHPICTSSTCTGTYVFIHVACAALFLGKGN
jgi:hypothetical protein